MRISNGSKDVPELQSRKIYFVVAEALDNKCQENKSYYWKLKVLIQIYVQKKHIKTKIIFLFIQGFS